MRLLADTSALIALSLSADRDHRRATEFLARAPAARFVVSDLILSELATRLAVRAGARRAAEVARGLLASRRYEVLFSDAGLLHEALALLEKFEDKRLSLTDCASFALMTKLGIDAAFSFDADFRDCGFAMVP
ncbi:MAG: type II toxin-antitoxin system VapC family toxin [Myxococcota bacterium]